MRLLGIFPALERAFDFTNHVPLVLISQFQVPGSLTAIGRSGLERRLRGRKVRHADKLAEVALRAARTQQTRIVGEAMAAQIIARLASTVIGLNSELDDIDKTIAGRFRTHRHAEVITSMTGISDLLGAEFLAATGCTLSGSPPPAAWQAMRD